MTEKHGPYDRRDDDPDDAVDGFERIGDALRQFVDERGWPLVVGHTEANGCGSRANDDGQHRNA